MSASEMDEIEFTDRITHEAGPRLGKPSLVTTLMGVEVDPVGPATILANAAIKKENGTRRTPVEAAARLQVLTTQFTTELVKLTAESASFATQKVDEYKQSVFDQIKHEQRANFAEFKAAQEDEALTMVQQSGLMTAIIGLLSDIPNQEGKQQLIDSLTRLAQQQVLGNMDRVRALDPDLYDEHEMKVPPALGNIASIFNNIFEACLDIGKTLHLELALLVSSSMVYYAGGSAPVLALILAYLSRIANVKLQEAGFLFKTTATEDLVAIFNGVSGVARDSIIPLINFVLTSSVFISGEVIKSVGRDVKNFVLMPIAQTGNFIIEVTKSFYAVAMQFLPRPGSSDSSVSSVTSIGSGTFIPINEQEFWRDWFGSSSSVSSSGSTATDVALSISSVASKFSVPGNSAAMLLLTNVASSSQQDISIQIPERVEMFSESQDRDNSTPTNARSLTTKEGVEILKRKREGGPFGGRKSRRHKKRKTTLKRRRIKRRRTRKGKKRRHTRKH
jgi:hypothetical protein